MHDGHKQAEELTMEHNSVRAFYLEIMLPFLTHLQSKNLVLKYGAKSVIIATRNLNITISIGTFIKSRVVVA
jgi:hypothetical protein